MPDSLAFARQRVAIIATLSQRFGDKKLNLIRPDTPSHEGIWCVPVTADDCRKIDDDGSVDEKFHVYLTNMPLPDDFYAVTADSFWQTDEGLLDALPWGGRCWGAEVIGTTRGADRPIALPEDQAPLDADAKLLYCGMLRLEKTLDDEPETVPANRQLH